MVPLHLPYPSPQVLHRLHWPHCQCSPPATLGPPGLDFLAAAASTSGTAVASATSASLGPSRSPTLTSKGLFNPAAAQPTKVVKRILDLDFVETAELTIEDDPAPGPSRLPTPARPPIKNISQWIERYSLMAVHLCSRFPDKAPELFAYQATIVRAERNYEDTRLYSEAFTGRARAITRCFWCLEDDHTEAACPKNPHRSVFGYFPDAMAWMLSTTLPSPWQPLPPTVGAGVPELCRRYNSGKCSNTTCKRRHVCTRCQGPHRQIECPQTHPSRDRSPHPAARYPTVPAGVPKYGFSHPR